MLWLTGKIMVNMNSWALGQIMQRLHKSTWVKVGLFKLGIYNILALFQQLWATCINAATTAKIRRYYFIISFFLQRGSSAKEGKWAVAWAVIAHTSARPCWRPLIHLIFYIPQRPAQLCLFLAAKNTVKAVKVVHQNETHTNTETERSCMSRHV